MRHISSAERWSDIQSILPACLLIIISLLFLTGCSTEGTANPGSAPVNSASGSEKEISSEREGSAEGSDTESNSMEEVPVKTKLIFQIDGQPVSVLWEDNESSAALRKLAEEAPLTIRMSMYGGFEQVGNIGVSLPRNDTQITAAAGDIVLYSGNQMVVFYGSNSWAYTRLGKITDKTARELAEILGSEDVTITITAES